jgi:hypothetical protein
VTNLPEKLSPHDSRRIHWNMERRIEAEKTGVGQGHVSKSQGEFLAPLWAGNCGIGGGG